MALRAVLFDLDGTLIDSFELILRSFEHTWDAHGFPPISREEWMLGIGRPLSSHFADYIEDENEIVELIRTYREFNHAHHDELLERFEGAAEAVAAIHEAGIALGIVTSKTRETSEWGLELCGFEREMFQAFVSADDDVEPKPSPAPVLRALEQLGGVSPEDAAFVGDSVHDMESGRGAGVLPVAALWGPFDAADLERAGALLALRRPHDLVTIIRS